jgi:hypothetical protein
MTKLLSQLLEAKEPQFHQTIKRLESASGNQCHDIRLSETLIRQTKEKIKELQLDPEDTTNQELYHSLLEKLSSDEALLIKKLRTLASSNISAEGNISDGIVFSIENLAKDYKSFGIRNSVVKSWLIKNPPKKIMKILGYRSVASMLKREPIPLLMSASMKVETASWKKTYLENLRKMKSSDFKDKTISVYSPKNERWKDFCSNMLTGNHQTVLINKELAAIVVLPLADNQPPKGLAIATLAIALNDFNAILSTGSYLRLSQVTSDFGHRLEQSIKNEPKLGFSLLDTSLSWETIQRFFHNMSDTLEGAIEEYMDLGEAKSWQSIESMIGRIEPKLEFWRGSSYLGISDHESNVSLNILDVALSLCNKRTFKQHFYHHQQRALWQEFILRYIQPDLLREAINQELQPKLDVEYVNA